MSEQLPPDENLDKDKIELKLEQFVTAQAQDTETAESDPTIGVEGARKRDKIYTNLLSKFYEYYVNEKETIKRQKEKFFKCFLGLMSIIGIGGIILWALALFVFKTNNLSIIISATIDIIVAFVAIPVIIAKHLFPEKADERITEVVKALVDNDKNIRTVESQRQNGK